MSEDENTTIAISRKTRQGLGILKEVWQCDTFDDVIMMLLWDSSAGSNVMQGVMGKNKKKNSKS